MKMFTFTTAHDTHKFGYEMNVPFTRLRHLHEMTSRELHGLRLREEWVLGMEVEYVYHEESTAWKRVKCEFITLDSFRIAYGNYIESDKVRIISFYAYQLHEGRDCVIHLESLRAATLDKQLVDLTGDGFGVNSFHDEADQNTLSPGGVIVHRKTGLKFYVMPGLVLDAHACKPIQKQA